MKIFKKYLAGTLAVCALSLASFTTACGDEGGQSTGGDGTPVEVAYTLALTDQDGNAIAGAQLLMKQGATEIISGTTDADGKITGTALEGAYTVQFVELPTGYLPDEWTVAVEISSEDSFVELVADATTPNGTQSRPYIYIPDETGKTQITLPAGVTHYYSARTMGRTLVITGADVEIVYDGTTYEAQNGEIRVPFKSEASNTFAFETFAIVSKSAEDLTFTAQLQSPLGSMENPIVVSAVGSEVTATVQGDQTVYYTFTATGTGTLTLTSSSDKNNIFLYNVNTSVQSDETAGVATVSITVSEGDVVSIRVSVTGSPASSAVNEIPFILTLAVE